MMLTPTATYSQKYIYNIIFIYIILYLITLLIFFTFQINLNFNLSKFSGFFSLHTHFTWILLFNVLLGTPPFLIFFIKIFLTINLIYFKLYGFVILVIFFNFLLAYIYLQNFFFLKKTYSFNTINPIKITIVLYEIQLWFFYINILGICFFPLFFGMLYIFL